MAEDIKSEEINSTKSENTYELSNSDVENSSKSGRIINNADEKGEPKKIENLERALKLFKRKSAGIISEVRKREAYDSPSVKRKKKSKEARKHKKKYRFNNN